MALSSVQLEQSRNAWAANVTQKIDSFEQGSAETLRLHIEAEKVSMLYEIAAQLAFARETRRG
jgi:hypothetical protein